MTGPDDRDDAPTLVRLPLLPTPDEMARHSAERRAILAQLDQQSTDAVQAVADCAAALGTASAKLDVAVSVARAMGATWPEIGRAVGISRQAAAQRWGAAGDVAP